MGRRRVGLPRAARAPRQLRGWRSALFVAAVEVAGSFAYFGVSANLITYLTGPLGQSNASAAAAVNAWSGTASLTPLAGAVLADACLGRYRAVLLACSLYVLGYGMMALSATLPSSSSGSGGDMKAGLFYASLYLVAAAVGVDKPCGLAFAADQFDAEHPGERAARGSLFNWWFFSMASGITVAVACVGYVQENVGWAVGFGLPCAVVLCASAVFLLGTPTYRLPSSSASFLEKLVHAGSDKDRVLRLLPIWASSLAYGVVYAQIMTFFNKQGRTLDRRVRVALPTVDVDFELPPAALQALGPLSILTFVPVYDRALVPALRRWVDPAAGLTLLQRVGTGMATSLAAVAVAAAVEARRLAVAREHGLDLPVVPMSWAWLVPQYALMGVADVLAVVGLQELFYDQMPRGMRSLGLALYLSVMGVGGLLSGILVSVIDALTGGRRGWFANNLNRGHLDYFYWLLAALSAAELLLYLYFARTYVYSTAAAPCSSSPSLLQPAADGGSTTTTPPQKRS